MEILANELRIGNWVKYKKYPLKLLASEIVLIEQGKIKCEPIPLTREVLEKCGFQASNVGNHIMYKNGVIIFFEKGKWGIRCDSRCSLNYLHQLQNLYFALTGEELDYKP